MRIFSIIAFNSGAVSSFGMKYSLINSIHFSAPIISCSILLSSSLRLVICCSSSICSFWYLLDNITKFRSVIFSQALSSYIFANKRSISFCLFSAFFNVLAFFLIFPYSLCIADFLYLVQYLFFVLLYCLSPILQSFQYGLIQHIITNVVHRTITFAKLSVVTASIITVWRFICLIRSKSHRPSTIRTIDKPCKYRRCLFLCLYASWFYLLLHTIEHFLVNNRLHACFLLETFTFGLTHFLFTLERYRRLHIVDTVSDIDFTFQYRLDMSNRPLITFTFGFSLKDMCKSTIPCKIQPWRCRNFFWS